MTPDRAPELDIDRLAALLGECAVGHTLDYHRTIASVMPRAYELADLPATRAGTLVICEEQTAGRGRAARQWHAAYASSLLAAYILKPPLIPRNPAQIPMAAGIAVVHALVESVPALAGHIWLKWPNDVLLGADPAAAGKVAGILVEAAFAGDALDHAILGIGINVNQTQAELPAADVFALSPASLRQFLGRPVDRTALLAALCQSLVAQFAAPRAPEDILHDWRDLLATLGRPVVVRTQGDTAGEIAGIAEDVTPSGDLIVEDACGRRHVFSAADVSLRPAP
jgi:BirA family biotin operon repressor/biotin-[acetyl-CoA-carboxylase] ligase